MALLKCPECSNEVSDKAVSCPKCGHPLQNTSPQAATPQAPPDVDTLVKQMFSQRGKIAAIKLYRTYNPSVGIAEAKQYVDRLEAGLPPGTVKNVRPQGCSPMVAFGGLFIAACAIFAIWGTISMQKPSSSDSGSPVSVVPAASPTQTSSEAPISSISWSELDAIYNLKSKNTDLQKNEAWSRYMGKKVSWSGTVSSVSDSLGSLSLQVKMNPDTWTSDLHITLKDSQKSRALTLKKGDSVTFTGILHNWGSLMPITLRDGEIR